MTLKRTITKVQQHMQGERVEARAEETSAAAAPEDGTIVIPVRGVFPHAQTDDQLCPTSRHDLPMSHSSSPARMKVGGATHCLKLEDKPLNYYCWLHKWIYTLECKNRCNTVCCTLANSCD